MVPCLILAGLALVAPLLPALPASAVAGTCEGRVATHLGTPGDDVLRGTDGDDVMVGLGGDDTISGLLGNDVICGDEVSDRLAGMAGDDRILGGLDSDAGGDVIWPGVGNDYVDFGLDPVTRDDYTLPADTVVYSDLLDAGFPGGIRADLTPVGGLGFVAEPVRHRPGRRDRGHERRGDAQGRRPDRLAVPRRAGGSWRRRRDRRRRRQRLPVRRPVDATWTRPVRGRATSVSDRSAYRESLPPGRRSRRRRHDPPAREVREPIRTSALRVPTTLMASVTTTWSVPDGSATKPSPPTGVRSARIPPGKPASRRSE